MYDLIRLKMIFVLVLGGIRLDSSNDNNQSTRFGTNISLYQNLLAALHRMRIEARIEAERKKNIRIKIF